MIRNLDKKEIRTRIHKRIRRKLAGTTERPRLAVFRSVAHIYAQVIDDSKGVTLVSASSVDKAAKTNGGNVAAAKAIATMRSSLLCENTGIHFSDRRRCREDKS